MEVIYVTIQNSDFGGGFFLIEHASTREPYRHGSYKVDLIYLHSETSSDVKIPSLPS